MTTLTGIYLRALGRVTITPDGCWQWTGACCSKGYPHVKVGGRATLLHRIAYAVTHGPIPEGMTIDHRCHDASVCGGGRSCPHRRCVNPWHLGVASRLANQRRAVEERALRKSVAA